jgi:hypothetical protein
MKQQLTYLREQHRNKDHKHHLYPLTYIELLNWFSLAWWGTYFLRHPKFLETVMAGSAVSIFDFQDFWTWFSYIICGLLLMGYLVPQIRVSISTFVLNGRTTGLILSAGYWSLFATLLWVLTPNSLVTMTYTVLAICILAVATRVLAYER